MGAGARQRVAVSFAKSKQHPLEHASFVHDLLVGFHELHSNANLSGSCAFVWRVAGWADSDAGTRAPSSFALSPPSGGEPAPSLCVFVSY